MGCRTRSLRTAACMHRCCAQRVQHRRLHAASVQLLVRSRTHEERASPSPLGGREEPLVVGQRTRSQRGTSMRAHGCARACGDENSRCYSREVYRVRYMIHGGAIKAPPCTM